MRNILLMEFMFPVSGKSLLQIIEGFDEAVGADN